MGGLRKLTQELGDVGEASDGVSGVGLGAVFPLIPRFKVFTMPELSLRMTVVVTDPCPLGILSEVNVSVASLHFSFQTLTMSHIAPINRIRSTTSVASSFISPSQRL